MDLPCLPPIADTRPPKIPSPAGACDTHFHIFGPVAKFPFAEKRSYTPDDAPLENLLKLLDTLGMARGVVVQGHPYGTDNSVVLDALKREPRRLRAAAIVKPDTGRDELKKMADAGVRALRFHHMPHGVGFSPLGMQSFEKLSPIMAELALHAQFMMDANALDSAMPFFRNWKLPIVLDHMGNVDATKGANQPGVQQMCRLLGEGRIWVKVSGAYRVSTQYPDYPDARAIHEALVRANPDQVLWGTDWPHPRLEQDMPEDGHLLDLFNAWTPDEALRRKILVDNPQKLYRFD
ncbi:MAG: amidohydrolase family protein [Burkholderiales bacterium]|nr:amidohydrolase family protein [Burkholderiales bacterium]